MKLYTFTAPTPADALKKAQVACGEDALVVTTRQIRKKSLNEEALFEIVVAYEGKEPKSQPQKTKTPPSLQKEEAFEEEIVLNISKTAQRLAKLSQQHQKENTPLPLTSDDSNDKNIPISSLPVANEEEFRHLKEDISQLTDKIRILQNMLWEEKASIRDHLDIPPEFAEIYKLSKQTGMKEAHLQEIMKETLAHMPSHMRENSQTVKRYFQVLLKKLIPIRMEREIPKGSQKIMMLVGPTGVGKTTTLAKLAARFSILEYRYKVGIITLDTYRIGAVEQLFQYAQMMKLPFEDVIDSNDFEMALENLSYCDLILIDTVGSSQHDKEKIRKIASFLENTDKEIDVNLVLSASSKLQDLKDAYESFSFANLDTLMITKIDETSGYGNVFSLIYEIKKPISYFSTGQEVPDDIQVATSDFLIECMFEGYKAKVTA